MDTLIAIIWSRSYDHSTQHEMAIQIMYKFLKYIMGSLEQLS